MLTSLDRKLVRDLLHMKGQAVMIALVVAAGVATFINSRTMLHSLETTRATFYDRYFFADVFAQVKRAPDSLRDRIAEIPGVARVETRIVQRVNLDVPGLEEPAVGQLVSLPITREPDLNRVYLRRGRMLEFGRNDEVLASEKFVEANELRVGDHVSAVINGRKKRLRIVGVVLSPEYVFQVKPGDLVPDPEHFGVFWMGDEALEMAFDMEGAFNDVSIGMMRGSDIEDVIFRLDQLIDPYGGLGAYGRRDQLSHMLLESDIEGLKTTGLVAPAIFLSVAAFLLNVVLARLLALQREQIAALKAFGYSNWQIGWHYLKLVLLIIIVGSLLGMVGGAYLASIFTRMIGALYQYPELIIRLDPSVVASAVSIASGAATLGAISAVWRAVRVPPAEAMRPEPPASFQPTFLERLGVGKLLPNVARMVLRQLERRPLKSALSIFAIALSVAIIVVGQFIQDSIDYTLAHQFFHVQRYDMVATLFEPSDREALHNFASVPGVTLAEPMRSVGVRIRAGHRHRRVAIMGVDRDGELFKLADKTGAIYKPPPGGLTLSGTLARSLDVGVGDRVHVEVLEGKRPEMDLPIVSVLDDLQGINAYTSLHALNRMLREGNRISGAYLRTDSKFQNATYRELKDTPRVAGVTVKRQAIQSFQDTLAKNMGTMKKINLFFACVIAVGVVYNSARIAQSERSRELATLRVVGFTRGEISAILLGELGVLTLLAMPVGCLLGTSFAWALVTLMDQEVFRFPLVIENSTYGIATGVVLLASTISGLLVRRSLDHLDLIAVLKARD